MIGGLHCGLMPAAAAAAGDVVIPPLIGGLHCGQNSEYEVDTEASVIPPLIGGLHCGWQWGILAERRDDVIPPLIGGLHCGERARLAGGPAVLRVIPPLIGGLHCGPRITVVDASNWSRHPAVDRRAPLRHHGVEQHGGADPVSSRR